MYSASGMAMASASVSWAAVLVFQLFTNLASFLTANCGGGASTGDDIVKLVLAAVDTSIDLGAMLAGLMKPDFDVRGLGGTTTGAATATIGLLGAGADCLALGLPVGTAADTLMGALAGALAGVLTETEIGAFVGVGALTLTAGAAMTGFLATGLALDLLATLTGGLDLAVLATGASGFLTGLDAVFDSGLAVALAGLAGAALPATLPAVLPAALGAGLAAGLLGLAAGLVAGLTATFLAGAALALRTGFFTVVDFLTVAFTFLSPSRLRRPKMGTAPCIWFSRFITGWGYYYRTGVGADCSDLKEENPINLKIDTNTPKSVKVLHQTLL